MSPQTMTIISGIVFLIVLVLAGWNLRRRRNRLGQGGAEKGTRHDHR